MEKAAITEFLKYVDGEILPANGELEKLEDRHRKHLQKLVYTNLVNRFDAMVDHAIIDNYNAEVLLDRGLKSLSAPVSEADMLRLLLKGTAVGVEIRMRVEAALSATVLRERHSRKLSTLFEALTDDRTVWNHPRVNISTGAILDRRKVANAQIPHSVCGYADWLYSRRNALVHGAGSTGFLINDKEQIKKLFNITVGTRISIKIGSITNAATFYKNVCAMLIKSRA